MFKCEVIKVVKEVMYQETYVQFKISTIGNVDKPNHKLTGSVRNDDFIIGQIDNSIKKGDLIRCDGLPYMTKPTYSVRTKIVKDSNGYSKVKIRYNLPKGYKPFQLDSGYWVLRRAS